MSDEANDKLKQLISSEEIKKTIAADIDHNNQMNNHPRELDLNSALVWFPPLVKAGLPVPRTVFHEIDHDILACAYGEDPPENPFTKYEPVVEAFGVPCFVRTDQSSAKHDGPDSYKISSIEDDLPRVLVSTVEDNDLKWLSPMSFMFREWLELEAPFKAFGFGRSEGHPIANEWRFKVGRGVVSKRCFYWPEGAIEGKKPTSPNWQKLLAEMAHREPPAALDYYALAAVEAVTKSDGRETEWSVDFACDVNGKWWLIDMAVAHMSWWPEEKND